MQKKKIKEEKIKNGVHIKKQKIGRNEQVMRIFKKPKF